MIEFDRVHVIPIAAEQARRSVALLLHGHNNNGRSRTLLDRRAAEASSGESVRWFLATVDNNPAGLASLRLEVPHDRLDDFHSQAFDPDADLVRRLYQHRLAEIEHLELMDGCSADLLVMVILLRACASEARSQGYAGVVLDLAAEHVDTSLGFCLPIMGFEPVAVNRSGGIGLDGPISSIAMLLDFEKLEKASIEDPESQKEESLVFPWMDYTRQLSTGSRTTGDSDYLWGSLARWGMSEVV